MATYALDTLSQPLVQRRSALDAALRTERARPAPDRARIDRLVEERDRIADRLHAVRYPL